MSYKDTKSFHKDYEDGGRKARQSLQKAAERREEKFAARRAENPSDTDLDVEEVTTLECNDCGYFGEKFEDFLPVEGNEGKFACPVCESLDSQPMEDDTI
jgi:hypothetical protein